MARYSDLILSESGLVSYWRLGESAGTIAADRLNANPGTYSAAVGGGTGVASAAGMLAADGDSAITFSSSQFANLGNNSSVQLATGSLECWAKTSQANDGGYHAIVVKTNAYSLFQLNTGNFGFFDWSAGANRDTGVAINDGKPHHLVVVFQSGSTIVYLDGQPVMTGALMTPADQTHVLEVAASSATQFLPCTVDEVALYNVVLSPTQVLAHFQANGLLAQFDQQSQFLPARLGPRRTG